MLMQSERRPIRLYIVRVLLGLALALLALMFILAFTVNGKWAVEESVRIDVPPADIYPLVVGLSNWELWTVWNDTEDSSLEREFKGPRAGVGSTVEWDRGLVSGVTRISSIADGQQVAFTVSFDQRHAFADGRIVLRRIGDSSGDLTGNSGTQVFMRLRGDAGTDPFEKLALMHYKPRLRHDMVKSLTRLRDKLEALKAAGDRAAAPSQQ